MLAHIEVQIHEMGYETVRPDVFTENPYAQKLYRKSGYQVRAFAEYEENELVAFYAISGECDEQYNNAEWEYESDSSLE